MENIKVVKSNDEIIIINNNSKIKLTDNEVKSLYHQLGQYLLIKEALK